MTPAQYEDMLSILNHVAAKLDNLEHQLGNGRTVTVGASAQSVAQQAPRAAVEVADDYDLDGLYGDPEIRKDPPRWTGESMVGKRYSDCTPEYLDNMAGFNTWRAMKDDESNALDGKGNPKSKWPKLDAARARGWAARIRAATPRTVTRTSSDTHRAQRVAQPASMAPPSHADDGDIPF